MNTKGLNLSRLGCGAPSNEHGMISKTTSPAVYMGISMAPPGTNPLVCAAVQQVETMY